MSDPKTAQATALEEQAKRFDALAEQATKIADHARTAAKHFRTPDVPRAGAHALALEGHMVAARRILDEIALIHAANSRAVP